MFPVATKVYPITDVRLTGLSHLEQVKRLIAGGARLIQLREKHLTPDQFYPQAEAAIEVAHRHAVKIIINDRVDLALALRADGVHLGQDDLPPQKARVLLGEGAIIGFSTHNFDQARLAANLPVDYVALGPIFGTSSKDNPDPAVGLQTLRRIRGLLRNRPLVAIGGITAENAKSAIESGADQVAVIGTVLADPDGITLKMGELLAALES